ncbi:hypothetical protein [Candidatus Villigracilis saccharophilus]|uniref:hypothetical protein n=1 Tax=Candidatus Villigracilis saccharophilus TaxID=3140684 RepID=UPI003135EB0D|nr:hypothetical protein [Anaerolineales bacterium]
MFEHRHEYLDDLPEVDHIVLGENKKETDFQQHATSPPDPEKFHLVIGGLHVQLAKKRM